MNQKTIRLSDDYRFVNGVVGVYAHTGEEETSDGGPVNYNDPHQMTWPVYAWQKSKYKIGARVMLLSHEDVSPDALRKNENIEEFFLRFNCHDGIGGNMNNDIKRYHGWRGTTSDVSTMAYGLREIIKIRKLKNGTVAVTAGHDLTVNEE